MPGQPFGTRVLALPQLGVGISTEFGAADVGLDPLELRARRPDLISLLEIGADLERGVDASAKAWVAQGLPVTYHFLDINLEEPEDVDPAWCAATAELARSLGAAWLCGDAGLWHMGPRDRGHGTLMPPILEPDSARDLGDGVRLLREATGFEVLPENPPASVYVGRMHLLDYFAAVAERADCGLLIDVAHLAIYQRVMGLDPRTALDGFPFERVVEMHVAGGTAFEWQGRTFVDDDHGLGVLDETWQLCEEFVERAPNLKALIFECERNSIEDVIPGFERLNAIFGSGLGSLAAKRAGCEGERLP